MISRFRKDRRGAVAVVVAVTAVAMMLFVGVAIDSTRAYYVKDVLQKSLDSAGLAAGATLDAQYLQSDAQEFFNANFASMGATAVLDSFNVNVDSSGNVISLSATATMETSFMALGGIQTVTVAASTEVTRETGSMEVVLVMDNTGSMSSSGKLDAMKTAATDLVNILFGSETVHPNLWVGLVPFASTVNVGARTGWLSAAGQAIINNDDYHPITWKGCMMARDYPNGDDMTEAAPSTEGFEPYWYEDTYYGYNNWIYGSAGMTAWLARDPNCCNVVQTDPGGASGDTGPNNYCGTEVTSLTPVKASVIAGINAMQARGWTQINQGMVWGWRLLSPDWRGLWGGETPAALPADYNDPQVQKAIVVLTDGDNTFNGTKTAYDTPANFGGSESARVAFLNNRLSTVCTNVKAQGVQVFAITFGGSISSGTQTLMQNCATVPTYYFHAPTNSQLQTVFQTIASELQALRISN